MVKIQNKLNLQGLCASVVTYKPTFLHPEAELKKLLQPVVLHCGCSCASAHHHTYAVLRHSSLTLSAGTWQSDSFC